MILCLDANVVIDIVRQAQPEVRTVWNRVSLTDRTIVISALVLHELETGIVLSHRPDLQRDRLAAVLSRCERVAFEPDDALVAGQVRAQLQRDGTPIGVLDTLIAAQALSKGWTVVTRNVRHFGRVTGLALIDWTQGPDLLSETVIARIVARD